MRHMLRTLRPDDAQSIARHADDEEVARWLRDAFPHPYSEADAQTFIEDCLTADPERQLLLAIAIDGEAVGSIGLFRGSDVYVKSAELGYWLGRDFWGRGVMTRAVEEICAMGFARWDIVRIHADPYAANVGSRRVLEKAGFTLEGTLRQSVFKRGRLQDSCVYALPR